MIAEQKKKSQTPQKQIFKIDSNFETSIKMREIKEYFCRVCFLPFCNRETYSSPKTSIPKSTVNSDRTRNITLYCVHEKVSYHRITFSIFQSVILEQCHLIFDLKKISSTGFKPWNVSRYGRRQRDRK